MSAYCSRAQCSKVPSVTEAQAKSGVLVRLGIGIRSLGALDMVAYQLIIRRKIGGPLFIQFIFKHQAIKLACRAVGSRNVISACVHPVVVE